MEETRVDGNVQGVLKTNSKILEASELKRLDKTEKLLVAGIHASVKGENCIDYIGSSQDNLSQVEQTIPYHPSIAMPSNYSFPD